MKLPANHKNLVPLLVLAGVCAFTVLFILFETVYDDGNTRSRYFTYQHYLAFGAVLLNLLVYFRRLAWFRFTLVGMLLLGFFNILHFTPDQLTISFTFSDELSLKFQPFSLLFIIVYYSLNKVRFHRFLHAYVLPKPSPQDLAKYQREQIAKFKTSFSKKSNESLVAIWHDQVLVPNAREAARQLLQERGINQLPTT